MLPVRVAQPGDALLEIHLDPPALGQVLDHQSRSDDAAIEPVQRGSRAQEGLGRAVWTLHLDHFVKRGVEESALEFLQGLADDGRLVVDLVNLAIDVGDDYADPKRPEHRAQLAPDLPTLRRIAQTTGGTFAEAPSAAKLEEVYRDLGTRLAVDPKRVEVTSAFAAGGAVLLLLGGALSSLWFRRAL